MFIKKLQLHNFQVVEDVDFDFVRGIYFLTGDNEVGKSTILNAIGTMLDGKRTEVLKNGEKKGFGKMIVGDDNKEYEVDLKFTENNPRGTLTIKSSDGMKSDNVGMLQKIFGYTDFDAVEFSRWSETAEGRRKQIAVVKSLLPKEVQERIEEIDSEVVKTKEIRKDANSEVKTYTTIVQNAVGDLTETDLQKYSKKIPIEELMLQQENNVKLIEKAKTYRDAVQTRTEQLAEIPSRIAKVNNDFEVYEQELLQKIEDARNQSVLDLEQIEKERIDFETRLKNASDWLKKYEENNPEKTDTAEKLKEAELHNEKHSKVVEYAGKIKQLKEAEEKAKKHDDRIKELLEERENLISTSSLPIEGLSFTDDGLELNGVPFVAGKVSDSQIMEIAMKLTVAVNPNVKVVRIARGESLGAKRLKQIIDHANANGFQGFIEQVSRGQEDLQVEQYTEM